MTLDNVGSVKTKPGLVKPETANFGFDFAITVSTIEWAFDLEWMIACGMDTGGLQLVTMDFDASYNYTIPSFTTASVSCGTTNIGSADEAMKAWVFLEYLCHRNPLPFYGLGQPQLEHERSYYGERPTNEPKRLLSTAPTHTQLTNTTNFGNPQHAKSTHLASQVLPKPTRLRGSVKMEPITSDD
jgi:hypothetical protein